MPEGPSIVILKEEAELFVNKKVLKVEGNTKIDLSGLKGKKVIALKTWGKHFLICFNGFAVRIHLMLFGSYRVNERREQPPRLSLQFKNGELNFYNCSVKLIEDDLDDIYDWTADTMSAKWNAAGALKKVLESDDELVCDILLDQNVFAGSGNIIKNEVLFITRIHPLSVAGNLPLKKARELVNETRAYCFQFYNWKKNFELKKHWLAYKQKICPRCNIPFTLKHLGKHKRRTFYCNNCQKLY